MSQNLQEKVQTNFFSLGRSMPWWLLGLSMVATTFSTDTPNLVTDIVRTNWSLGELGLVGLFDYRLVNGFCIRKVMA